MAYPPVAVIILSWNGRHYLERFLPSVVQSSYENLRIIIADNCSSDNTEQWLAANYPEVEFLQLGKNYGFAEGYNQAISQIDEEYLILLNQDVETTDGWIEPLVQILESRPEVVALQPKIRAVYDKSLFEYAGASGGFIDVFGYPFCRGRIFHHLESDTGQYDTVIPIAWATGACLVVRRSFFISFGGFDGELFAHMEEIDLCWRFKNAGWEILCEPASVVYHLGGGSLPKDNPRKTFLNFRNNLALITKNSRQNIFVLLSIRLVLDWLASARFLLTGEFLHSLAVIKAQFHFLKKLPHWYKKRRELRRTWVKASPSGFYPFSILWDVHFRKVRTFAGLRW